MSQFTTPLTVELLDDYKFLIVSDFTYFVGSFPSDERIVVHAGFVTDLASIPRAFWNVLPPHGKYAKAAVLHDWLYTNGIGSKKYADDVFNESMKVLGVPEWKRWIMYQAVRMFGKGMYK